MTINSIDPREVASAIVDPLTKADQAAWEAPELRPVFTPHGKREQWAYPCPEWCTGDGSEHEVAWIDSHARRHVSHPLRVRQDATYGWEGEEDGREGMFAGFLEVFLIAGSRSPHEPRVQITAHGGSSKGDGEKEIELASLYPDEVRELICVLQHLLKVGQS